LPSQAGGFGIGLARQIAEAHDSGVALTAVRTPSRVALACLWLPVRDRSTLLQEPAGGRCFLAAGTSSIAH